MEDVISLDWMKLRGIKDSRYQYFQKLKIGRFKIK